MLGVPRLAETRVLIVPVGRGGVAVVEAAVSTILRVYEEYVVDKIIVVHRSSPLVEKVLGLVKNFLSDRVEVELKDFSKLGEMNCSGPGAGVLERRFRKLVEEYCGSGEVVVAVSSGSRRLAASLAIAGLGEPGSGPPICGAEIVHVDFYWGSWSNLFYPYTPRPLQPVLSLFPVLSMGEDTVNVAELYPDLTSTECMLPNGTRLPPLRCRVAELARRINSVVEKPVFRSRGEDEVNCNCGGIEVELDIAGKRIREGPVRYCNHHEVGKLLSRLLEKLRDATRGLRLHEYLVRELMVFTGTIPLLIDRVEGLGQNIGKNMLLENVLVDYGKVIVDTNLVYYGLHNYVNRIGGQRFILPYCVVAEIHSRYGEAVKKYRGPGCDMRCYMDVYAYLALKEILASSVSIVSTPPTPTCEASILQLDPFIIADSLLVTSDKGAYELWRNHPVSRIAAIAHTYYDADKTLGHQLPVSETYYSLLQLLVLLNGIPGVNVKVRVNDRRVDVPRLRIE